MFGTTVRMTGFLLALTLLTGGVYPLVVGAVSHLLWPWKAGGSMVAVDGRVVGSQLIGQKFTGRGYFHARPSAVDFAADSSGASNLGATSRTLLDEAEKRATALRLENSGASIPDDLIAASGSGLDPHITPEAAQYQARRVAAERGLAVEEVVRLIDSTSEGRTLGLLGMPRVNVLRLNIELDRLAKR